MTRTGTVYAAALYALAKEEGLEKRILDELLCLQQIFSGEPGFLRLLSAPNVSKQERCHILDGTFRGKVQAYVLNFLKLLTEKGYARHFADCCAAYHEKYNEDNGILPVTAVTAAALTGAQRRKLIRKLEDLTDKEVRLTNRVDPTVLGGVRLQFAGRLIDGTAVHRLEAVGKMLTQKEGNLWN